MVQDYGITPKRLATLLSYDPQSGVIRWRSRPVSDFRDERVAKSWNSKHAGAEGFTAISHGYRVGRCNGRNIPAHRVAWCLHFGKWPVTEIDHINGLPSDNRIANLRAVDHRSNGQNAKRPSTNTSGQVGVSFHKATGRWHAYIGDTKRGSRWNIGFYASRDEAMAARLSAQNAMGYHSNHGRGFTA
jgi:hypothetical protein